MLFHSSVRIPLVKLLMVDGLRFIKISKAPGPDEIPDYFLSHYAVSISYPIYLLFSKSL